MEDISKKEIVYIAELDGDIDEAKAIFGQMMDELGGIVINVFDIHLEDQDGVEIEYTDGDGIKITLSSSEMIDGVIDLINENYDGDYELVVGHLKHDGTYEYLPLTDNGDGTYSFTATSLSDFALIARGTSSGGDTPVPQTSDDAVLFVSIAVVSMLGLGLAVVALRKNAKR